MSIEYAAVLISGMIAGMLFEESDWKFQGLCPYLAPYMSESESQEVCKIVYKQCYLSCIPKETQEDEHDDGEHARDVDGERGIRGARPRERSADALEPAGQRIGVLLPFSEGRYYEEFLVNTKALTAEFAARGFGLVASTSAAGSIADFEARNRAVAALLTEGDRRWLALYGELVFQRNK
jgi:hypothetical protein